MPLFENVRRSRDSNSKHSESQYKFLNESSWNSVEYYRSVIEKWYSEFPSDESFFGQFTSKNDDQHESAFFELFMYSFCRALNYEVKYHESIGSRKIDLTLSRGVTTLLADCVLSGKPNLNSSIAKIEKEMMDIVEDIKSPEYWISLEFQRTSHTTPKLSQFRARIEELLNSMRHENDESKTVKWEKGDWIVEIAFSKKSPLVNRALGLVVSSQGGGFIDGLTMRTLRRTLNDKRGSNYGVDKPYLIMVNSSNVGLFRELIIGTLYGEIAGPGFSNNLYLKDSFFINNKEPQNTSVSGIVLVKGLSYGNMGTVDIEIWENPWARFPLNSEFQELKRYLPKLNRDGIIEEIQFINGWKTHEILKIREHYFDLS